MHFCDFIFYYPNCYKSTGPSRSGGDELALLRDLFQVLSRRERDGPAQLAHAQQGQQGLIRCSQIRRRGSA